MESQEIAQKLEETYFNEESKDQEIIIDILETSELNLI
jgi:hypothetical protein